MLADADADVADDGGEDEDRNKELDDDKDVLEDRGRVRNVTHHGQGQSRPVERVRVRIE